MSALDQIKPPWFDAGFGLTVLTKLSKRYGQGWEDGVFHKGGISTGTWIVTRSTRTGMRLFQILALYDTEHEFLND